MNQKIGRSDFPASYFARLWLAAVIAAAVAWGIKVGLHPHQPQIAAVLILVPYGAVYLGCTAMFGVEQAGGLDAQIAFKIPSIAREPYSRVNFTALRKSILIFRTECCFAEVKRGPMSAWLL